MKYSYATTTTSSNASRRTPRLFLRWLLFLLLFESICAANNNYPSYTEEESSLPSRSLRGEKKSNHRRRRKRSRPRRSEMEEQQRRLRGSESNIFIHVEHNDFVVEETLDGVTKRMGPETTSTIDVPEIVSVSRPGDDDKAEDQTKSLQDEWMMERERCRSFRITWYLMIDALACMLDVSETRGYTFGLYD